MPNFTETLCTVIKLTKIKNTSAHRREFLWDKSDVAHTSYFVRTLHSEQRNKLKRKICITILWCFGNAPEYLSSREYLTSTEYFSATEYPSSWESQLQNIYLLQNTSLFSIDYNFFCSLYFLRAFCWLTKSVISLFKETFIVVALSQVFNLFKLMHAIAKSIYW